MLWFLINISKIGIFEHKERIPNLMNIRNKFQFILLANESLSLEVF